MGETETQALIDDTVKQVSALAARLQTSESETIAERQRLIELRINQSGVAEGLCAAIGASSPLGLNAAAVAAIRLIEAQADEIEKLKKDAGLRGEMVGEEVLHLQAEIDNLKKENGRLQASQLPPGTIAVGSLYSKQTAEALFMVAGERKRQDEKWKREPGQWPSYDGFKLAVLMEEVGEVATEIIQTDGPRTQQQQARLFNELTQVAAVAVCWMETIAEEEAKRP